MLQLNVLCIQHGLGYMSRLQKYVKIAESRLSFFLFILIFIFIFLFLELRVSDSVTQSHDMVTVTVTSYMIHERT